MFPPLYAVLDEELLRTPALHCATVLVSAGVNLIQYRAKNATSRAYFATCSNLAEALANSNARLIINDRPDIAAMVGAGGVHVGQEDLQPEDARRICGSGRWVGVSTHNLEQVCTAAGAPVDYIAVGPIYSTTTKKKTDPVVGPAFIREARKLTRKPIVAIGGITLERAPEVYAAGANSVVVIRDILQSRDPAARAREYLALASRPPGISMRHSQGNFPKRTRNG